MKNEYKNEWIKTIIIITMRKIINSIAINNNNNRLYAFSNNYLRSYRISKSTQSSSSSSTSSSTSSIGKESGRNIAKRIIEQQQQQQLHQQQQFQQQINSNVTNSTIEMASDGASKNVRKIAENAMKVRSQKVTGSTYSGIIKGATGLGVIGGIGFWLGFTDSGNIFVDDAKYFATHNPVADMVNEKLLDPIVQPVRDKLLPDFPENIEPFPTLVLDLEDTLVHMEWDRKYGWRIAKRPGLDAFLMKMAQTGYEIVIFTSGVYTSVGDVVVMVSIYIFLIEAKEIYN